jgi:hypothetical protein
MNSFSQRKGLKPINSIMQVDSMDQDLRTGLWNGLQLFYWETASDVYHLSDSPDLSLLIYFIWRDLFKRPVDEVPQEWHHAHLELKHWFFDRAWYEVYDFIEFVADTSPQGFDTEGFISFCNSILKREMSAYRFVGGVVTQLTSDQEIAEVEQAINAPAALNPVSTHLRTALERLSDKTNPDYRNSIKESISAVESMCNLITGGKDTLGDALNKVENKVGIHAALKKGFSNIYGYTNDASGIRHALLDEPNLDFEDAKYMLVSCSAFINYLASKAVKAGVTF